MKRLILMRHAKSSWADPGQRDLDRPLNRRGRRSAALIGEWLHERNIVPDHALVSSARRTQETWAGMVAVLGAAPTTYLPELYHASAETMLEVVHGAPEVDTLLVLGHQPGIGGFAGGLLAERPSDSAFSKFPTATTAIIGLAVAEWSEVALAEGQLIDFVVPRSLED